MARPKEFDETTVLDAAVECFWARGYEATSVRELAASMGIAGASMYNAFGDKSSLYRRALDRYVDQSFQDRVRRFEERMPPREAIGAFFNEIVTRSLSDQGRKGCMLVNAALEMPVHDPATRAAITEVVNQIEAFFRRCVAAGQADGTIVSAETPEDLARLLLGALMGIRVLARVRPERELLEGIVGPVMNLLDNCKTKAG
jgi:TetR/AcrR family transcriptional repressor of nem operon